jgi:tetrahydromethanopterin S-methyltransferase subunit B
VRFLLRLLSPLLGLVVAAVGVITAIEVVTAWVAPTSSPLIVPWPQWQAAVTATTWTSSIVRGVAIGVGVVGLLVLLVGLVARRHDVRLTDPVPEVTVTTSPRSLARAIGHEVRSHSDVVAASVVASSRRVVVKAGTLDTPDTVRDSVRERIDELLVRLPLARRPRVSVSVAETKGVK